MRGGDTDRFEGMGVPRACALANGPLASLLVGKKFSDLAEPAPKVFAADGPGGLGSSLGSNVTLAVSQAVVLAPSARQGRGAFRLVSELAGCRPRETEEGYAAVGDEGGLSPVGLARPEDACGRQ